MYQVYDVGTGRIRYSAIVEPDIAEHMRQNGETLIEGEGGDLTHWVDIYASPPAVRPRPAQGTRQDKTHIAADGEDTVTLSPLPRPCDVWVGDKVFRVDDGIFELATALPGEYILRVEAFPYMDWAGAVTAL